ncbi:iron-siderophore ABC transporter substrate-binding protein [Celeribacter sp. ULVN23_4]
MSTSLRLVSCATALLLSVTFSPVSIEKATAQPEAFSRHISHALGEATVAIEPTRILTLGWSGEDALFALGVRPIAMPKYPGTETGVFPWNAPYLGEPVPELMPSGLDFEEIAALDPDLILAIRSGVNDKDYARLSAIAPTVVYRSGPWIAGWRELTRMTGEALGRADEAEAQIVAVESQLAEMRAAYPDLEGKSFIFGTYFPGQSSMVIYLPSDPRVQIFEALGLTVPDWVRKLGEASPGKASVSISLEQADRFGADLLVMWYREGALAAAEAQPMFSLIPAVRAGGHIAMTSPAEVWGTSTLSVLAIPYVFPGVLDRLSAAVVRMEEGHE